ncbi:energy transducer TonB [Parerythrobacter aurantius]|uniref:energy transducer TonB n=1 Tax=Parerythrobacter aurantius TaxID=3127706 RepID=UPI00324D849F
MAYADTAGAGTRGPAVVAVAAIHAALAVVVVTGLAGGVAKMIPGIIPDAVNIPLDPVEPPPPDQPAVDEPRKSTKIVIPEKPFDLPLSGSTVDGTEEEQDYTSTDTTAGGSEGVGDGLAETGGAGEATIQRFTPVAPKARNGNWVTDNDYRTSWISREWEGTAGFRLTIGSDGRVSDCTITRSTGHSALDDATCSLVTRRARFEPARNDRGEVTSGTFSSAVEWRIPD